MSHVEEFIKAEQAFRRRQEQAVQDQLQRDYGPSFIRWSIALMIGIGVSAYVIYWLWRLFSSLFGIAGEQ